MRLLVGILHMDTHQIAEVLRTGFIPHFPGSLRIKSHQVQGDLRVGLQIDIRIMMAGAPDDRLRTAHPWDPDGRVWLLQGALEGVHHPELIVLTLPTERPWARPGLDDQ